MSAIWPAQVCQRSVIVDGGLASLWDITWPAQVCQRSVTVDGGLTWPGGRSLAARNEVAISTRQGPLLSSGGRSLLSSHYLVINCHSINIFCKAEYSCSQVLCSDYCTMHFINGKEQLKTRINKSMYGLILPVIKRNKLLNIVNENELLWWRIDIVGSCVNCLTSRWDAIQADIFRGNL
jgi:hypothetical protein